MKYRLSGLLVIFAGIACACITIIFPQLTSFFKAGLWLAAALLIIIGGAMLKKESEKTPEQIAPYEAAATRYAKKPHILTPPEYNLYMLLRDLYGGRYEILAQTSLVSLVDKLNYNSYLNELFRIVDFVIADKEFSPLVVIELNDSSHLRADRRERDRKVAEILEKADLPLVTFSTEEAASSAAVRRALWRYLH